MSMIIELLWEMCKFFQIVTINIMWLILKMISLNDYVTYFMAFCIHKK